jgi:hypothetical protein
MDLLIIVASLAQIASAVWTFIFGSKAISEIRAGNARPTGIKLSTLLILCVAIIILIVSFIITSSILHPITVKPIGGVDITDYCKDLEYKTSGTITIMEKPVESCYSNIDLNSACDWQYKGENLYFELKNRNDPKSGACYDSPKKEHELGGIREMKGYCEDKHHQSFSNAVINKEDNNTWVCQIELNYTITCIFQYQNSHAEARKNDQGLWECVA